MKAIFWEGEIEDNYIGHIFSEVFKDKIYEPLLPKNKENTVCLEIGANIGLVALYFSKYFDKVYSVEPSLEHFASMAEMLKYNEIKNVTPINKAVWLRSEKLPLFHNKNRTMYSLHTAVSDPTLPPETVDATTLSDLFKEQGITHVDLMKLDVEGSEYDIVCSNDFKEVADKIDKIIIERHQWANRNPEQLTEALKMNGFVVSPVPSSADLILASK